MPKETLQMSLSELDRLKVIEATCSKRLTQVIAAKQLGLSRRQIIRLCKAYRTQGAKGLISKHRGKPSNNRLKEELKNQALELVSKHYSDFGPTLAKEKLAECHAVELSVETLRQLMIEAGIWKGRSRKQRKVIQQMRTRRPCFGELVQIDGSPHAWFEDRAPNCCLLVFIDDATSKLVALHFVPNECLEGYFQAMRQHLKSHGRPLSYYSDKHSIFRLHIPEAKTGNGLTQFGRACQELGIETICANTPQAKGRVERANKTLQDRLVKELRLAGISDIKSANAFLPGFLEKYNQRFAVAPSNPQDAHRPLGFCEQDLKHILCRKETRKISNQLEFSYQNRIYQIQVEGSGHRMKQGTVTLCEFSNEVTVLYEGKVLTCKVFDKNNRPARVCDSKEVNKLVDKMARPKKKTAHKPKANHAWNASIKQAVAKAQAKAAA